MEDRKNIKNIISLFISVLFIMFIPNAAGNCPFCHFKKLEDYCRFLVKDSSKRKIKLFSPSPGKASYATCTNQIPTGYDTPPKQLQCCCNTRRGMHLTFWQTMENTRVTPGSHIVFCPKFCGKKTPVI